MGLFDSHKPSEPRFPRDQKEAVFCLLVGAATCGGVTQNEEIQSALTSAMLSSRVIGEKAKELIIAHHKRCLQMWHAGDHASTIRSCANLIEVELRESLFMHVCGLVLADDNVEESEIRFIETTQQALGIGEGRARVLVDFMIVLKKL